MPTIAIVQTTEKTNVWRRDLARELDWDGPEMVYLAPRAVLHRLRDRLPVDESAQFASQLPTLIRGYYYEKWDPKSRPPKVNATQFLASVTQAFPFDFKVDAKEVATAIVARLS